MHDERRRLSSDSTRALGLIALALCAALAAPAAGGTKATADPGAGQTAESSASLRFLRANRLFLLSHLAASRGPGALDPRALALLDAELLAALRTLGEAEMLPRTPLAAAADLPELVQVASRLDSLTTRMTGIEARLTGIREDFALNQSTELLIALAAPAAIASDLQSVTLKWNGYPVANWQPTPDERAALAAGAYRPLHRSFARPQTQTIEIELSLTGRSPSETRTTVEPESNRLTIVVLEAGAAAIQPRVWTF